VQVPPTVTVFSIGKTLDQGAIDILATWQVVGPSLPDDLAIRVKVQGQEALFLAVYLRTCSSLVATMGREFPELGMTSADCRSMTWLESAALSFTTLANIGVGAARGCTLSPLSAHSLEQVRRKEKNTLDKVFRPAHERRRGRTDARVYFFFTMATWCSLARFSKSTGGERAYKAVARTHDHHSAPTTRTHTHTHPLVHAQLAAACADDSLQRNHRGRPATGLGPPLISLTN
jgi:hypothetical protein